MKQEWLHPYSDDFNSGFSAQEEISRGNAAGLKVIWTSDISPSVPEGGDQRQVGVQTTPLVVDGTVFLGDGYHVVHAFDAEDGGRLWSFDSRSKVERHQTAFLSLNFKDGILYFMSANMTLYGLNPKTGRVVKEFPGLVDRVPGVAPGAGYCGEAAPSFFGSSAIFGASTQGITTPKFSGRGVSENYYAASARGFVGSLDLEKGKINWMWFSVPPARKGPKRWHTQARKGNMLPYPNDWGESDRIGGGGLWGTAVVDEPAQRVYLSTGNSDLFVYSDLDVPGPNLFTDCVVCLDARSGKMRWYYQATPHDLLGWDIGWNTLIADVDTGGKKLRAVIAASKNNHVYVLDANTGKPLYAPVRVGYNVTPLNSDKENLADMKSVLKPGFYSPGHLGGINAPLAFAYNTVFVASQRLDQVAKYYAAVLNGKKVKGVHLEHGDTPEYSTLYAIDAGRGEVKWTYFMKTTFQSAAITVSGGLVFATERGGVLHLLDAESGAHLKEFDLGGYGRAGTSLGSTRGGKTRAFVPVSGRGGAPNRLVCLGAE
ncbi:MAG TPA: PQQ-binding-like beta-propeller repeat protein [Nitrososphaerales archaeon]|nr:PQQ-binding-like beta-propeller repeat protein [Nitrososphaerales archaeon]